MDGVSVTLSSSVWFSVEPQMITRGKAEWEVMIHIFTKSVVFSVLKL
jgi:hypothetical protein